MTEAAASPPVSDAPAPPPVIDAAAPPPAPAAAPKGEAPPSTDDRSWLPEDMRESADLSRYKSPADLAKAYRNLSNLVGREKVPLPKGDDDATGWDHLYNALGRPEKPDGYEIKAPEKLPDGFVYDPAAAEWFKDLAHKAGLNKKQAAMLHDGFVDRTAVGYTEGAKAQAEAEAMQLAQAERELKTEWGAAFTHQTIIADNAARKLGGEAFAEHIKAQGYNRDPQMMKFLANVGKAIGGLDQLPGGGGPSAMTPADIEGEANKLRGEMMGMNQQSPDYQAKKSRLDLLYRMKHGAV